MCWLVIWKRETASDDTVSDVYPNVSLDVTLFTHVAAVGNDDYDVTLGRHKSKSTRFHIDVYEGFILIFKQARTISIKYICL